MASRQIAITILACLSIFSPIAAERWSRQIAGSGFTAPATSVNDWVPISQNCPTCHQERTDRASNGRVLNFGSSAVSLQQHLQSQFPTNTYPATNEIKQQSQQQFSLLGEPFTGQRFLLQPGQQIQFHPPQQQQQQLKPQLPPNPYQFELQNPFHQIPQSQQQFIQKPHFPQLPPQFVNDQFFAHQEKPRIEPLIQSKPSVNFAQDVKQSNVKNSPQQEEEIQLLYVPLDTLYNQQKNQPSFQNNNRYNLLPPPINPAQINDFYTPQPSYTKTTSTTTTTTTTTTTPKPDFTRPKPHQPPLAMFMFNENNSKGTSVNAVLNTLKNAKSIAVLDSPTKNAPKVFIGPSGLNAPDGYSKFELPYLSNIEHNRYERRVENLPFFVAPVSYHTPDGFAKIPLPAPHVGSVVINTPAATLQPEVSSPTYANSFFTTPRPQQYDPQSMRYITPFTENYDHVQPSVVPQVSTIADRYKVEKPTFTTPAPTEYYTTLEPQNAEEVYTTPAPQNYNYNNNEDRASGTNQRQPNSQRSQNINSFGNTNPQLVNENYFNLQKINKPSSVQPSSQDSSSDTSYKSIFDNRFHTNTFAHQTQQQQIHKAPEINTEPPQNYKYQFTQPQSTRGITQTTPKSQDIFNMKNYFKEQDAFKTRPQIRLTSSTSTPDYESVSYTTPPKQEQFVFSTQVPVQKDENEYAPITPSPPSRDTYKASIQTGYSTASNLHSPKETFSVFENNRKPNVISFGQTAAQNNRNTLNYNANAAQNVQDQSPAIHKFKFVQSVVPEYAATTSRVPEDRSTSLRFQPTYQDRNIYRTTSTTQAPEVDVQRYRIQPLRDSNIFQNKYHSQSDYQHSTVSNQHESDQIAEIPKSEKISNTYELVETEQPITERISVAHPTVTTTEENSYNLPSELPPINVNLPGLVNSLMENDQHIEEPITTTTHHPTRRPITRGRRPPVTRTTASTTSVADTTTSTRRPIQRGRTRPTRPYTSSAPSTNSYRTSTVVRNPNRVRYNPTTEERQSIRSRTRTQTATPKEEENLDYQRDVLNQNYPVIKPIQTTTTTTEVSRKYEEITAEPENYPTNKRQQFIEQVSPTIPNRADVEFQHHSQEENYREYSTPVHHASVAPSETPIISSTTSYTGNDEAIDRKEIFTGLNVPMQVPQEYQLIQKNENTNNDYRAEDEPPVHYNDENSHVVLINNRQRENARPVYVSSTEPATTTTPAATTTRYEIQRLRRPSFVKRPTRPLYTTTQAPSVTTLDNNHNDRYTVRPRSRTEVTTEKKAIKIRGRLRKPITTTTKATTPTSASSDVQEPAYENAYGQYNQYTEDYYTEAPAPAPVTRESKTSLRGSAAPRQQYRPRTRSRFTLDTQESQWSTKLSQNSFQPIDPKETGKSLKVEGQIVDEPEIVTARFDADQQDTFLFNVTPGNNPAIFNANEKEGISNNTRETSLSDLLDEVITDMDNELVTKQEGLEDRNEIVPVTKKIIPDEKKPDPEKKGKRRGVWRRVRVRPVLDTFETAESQNIGRQFFNVLPEASKGAYLEKGYYNNDFTKNQDLGQSIHLVSHQPSEQVNIIDITTLKSPGDVDLGIDSPTEVVPESAITTMTDENVESTTELFSRPDMTTISEIDETTTNIPDVIVEQTNAPSINDDSDEFPAKVEKITDRPTIIEDVYEAEFSTENDQLARREKKDNEMATASIFDEVRKKLSDLFSLPDNDDQELAGYVESRQQEQYHSPVQRTKEDVDEASTTETPKVVTDYSPFMRDPMGSLIIATSTSTEVSHETEICYRGRCVKTAEEKKKKH